ncbi:MAG: hypothetical protein HFJ37_03965 [Clostridia bacterium]|nr:hypothetical protein [Clostridia bacterium]
MFVYHVKINGSKVFKSIFIGMLILLVGIVGMVVFKIFHGAAHSETNSSCLPQNGVCKISTGNYTNILKSVHDHIDDYVGVKINFTGYVYRVLDLKENQFILARDMIISSDFQSVVVGFLCEYPQATNLEDNTWVEITGEIMKGEYHGDMPIVKITNVHKVNQPNEEYVYPPDESYIPTAGIL